jgi:hypothetical protein
VAEGDPDATARAVAGYLFLAVEDMGRMPARHVFTALAEQGLREVKAKARQVAATGASRA